MPFRYARAAARSRPSVRARERCLRSITLRRDWCPPRALEALALPAAEAPDVALDLARVDLAAGQVHVGAGDQPPLVALERHPLGQDVVGVGQARAAVRLGLVRELDAVLVQQAAGLREVGDDRLVRVDQVRVRDALELLVERSARPRPGSGPGRGTSPTPPRSRTSAGARGRAARRGARGPGRRRGCHPRARAALRARRQLAAAVEVREHDLPQEGDDDDRRGAEGDGHRGATARRPRRAGRR